MDGRWLDRQWLAAAVVEVERERPQAALAAAEEAPRVANATLALAAEDGRVAQGPVDPAQAATAPPGSRSARGGHKFIAFDEQRILILQRLDG